MTENIQQNHSYEVLPINQLTFLDSNPRTITAAQMRKLESSLEEDPSFLVDRPILVNKVDDKYIVYAGNQRVKAAKRLGWKEIICSVSVGLSNEQMQKRVIKDNAHFGVWDWDELANQFDITTLLDAGLTESELHIGEIEEIASEGKKESKKKLKMCPECGCEF